MQVTGQLFTCLLLEFDHAFALIHHVLVETCILDGNHCLAAKDIQKFTPTGREKIQVPDDQKAGRHKH